MIGCYLKLYVVDYTVEPGESGRCGHIVFCQNVLQLLCTCGGCLKLEELAKIRTPVFLMPRLKHAKEVVEARIWIVNRNLPPSLCNCKITTLRSKVWV